MSVHTTKHRGAKVAVFPGSFDPITRGHVDIVRRASPLFDQIIVAVGVNIAKNYFFPLDQRIDFVCAAFEEMNDKVKVEHYQGLTAEYCRNKSIQYIVRGVRNVADFEFEKTVAQVNSKLNEEVETLFFMTSPENSIVHSTIVRDIINGSGDLSFLVPDAVLPLIQRALDVS